MFMFNLHDTNKRDPPTVLNGAIAVCGLNTSGPNHLARLVSHCGFL